MQITVIQGQSILDVALQYYGDIAGVMWLVEDNHLSITSDLVDGQLLHIRNEVINQDVVTAWKNANYVPLTALPPLPQNTNSVNTPVTNTPVRRPAFLRSDIGQIAVGPENPNVTN